MWKSVHELVLIFTIVYATLLMYGVGLLLLISVYINNSIFIVNTNVGACQEYQIDSDFFNFLIIC